MNEQSSCERTCILSGLRMSYLWPTDAARARTDSTSAQRKVMANRLFYISEIRMSLLLTSVTSHPVALLSPRNVCE